MLKKSAKYLPAALTLVLLGLAGAGCEREAAVALDWPADLPQALAKARTEHKLVLVDFTGSDWCPGCIKIGKQVFSTKEFQDYAQKNLELVEVDFPEQKKQPEELKKANEALSKKFQVEGYPTLFLLDADGKVLNKQEGYGGETPAEFIAGLEKARKQS